MSLIVGIGEVLWDRFPDGDRLGGAPANFTFHAAQLGATTRLVSRIGKDNDGERLLIELHKKGLSREFIQIDSEHPTGVVKVSLNHGQPEYFIQPAAWDHLEINDQLRSLAAKTDAVCFGTLAQRGSMTRETLCNFVQLCRPDTIRFFDLNLRQSFYSREIIEFGLRNSTILKLNEEELHLLGKILGWKVSAVIDRLLTEFHFLLIALTLGARGCELHASGHTIRATATPISCLSAVGAGDAFSATLIVGLLKNRPLEEIAERANRIGGYVASHLGATPPLLPEHLWI